MPPEYVSHPLVQNWDVLRDELGVWFFDLSGEPTAGVGMGTPIAAVVLWENLQGFQEPSPIKATSFTLT